MTELANAARSGQVTQVLCCEPRGIWRDHMRIRCASVAPRHVSTLLNNTTSAATTISCAAASRCASSWSARSSGTAAFVTLLHLNDMNVGTSGIESRLKRAFPYGRWGNRALFVFDPNERARQ
uniref:Uncharacterized protein n=1 Tax=Solibacter usitatus (strain Ellin6076) TaxID=234267 RepID=Q01TM1_SOLUE